MSPVAPRATPFPPWISPPSGHRAGLATRPLIGILSMNRSTVASRWNLDLIEENYRRWQADPASVEATWRAFFEGYDLGAGRDGAPADGAALDAARAQANVTRLIDAYRE